jgi:hypothetical protein
MVVATPSPFKHFHRHQLPPPSPTTPPAAVDEQAMPRSQPESTTTVAQKPKLGFLLPLITPLHHELQFWVSDAFLRAAADIDPINFFLRTCEYSLFLFRCLSDIPEEASRVLWRLSYNLMALVALNVALLALFHTTYMQSRWVLLFHSRSYCVYRARVQLACHHSFCFWHLWNAAQLLLVNISDCRPLHAGCTCF